MCAQGANMAALKKIIVTIWDKTSTLFVSSHGELHVDMKNSASRSRETYFSLRDEQVGRF